MINFGGQLKHKCQTDGSRFFMEGVKAGVHPFYTAAKGAKRQIER
jgi:hypothetical protein